jgi:hypothetical protein
MTEDIERLRVAIKQRHGCEATHSRSEHVTETYQRQLVWNGTVQVFSISGHATADTCFAWIYTEDDGSERYTTVLNAPPVDSARAAVRAAIVAEFQKRLV